MIVNKGQKKLKSWVNVFDNIGSYNQLLFIAKTEWARKKMHSEVLAYCLFILNVINLNVFRMYRNLSVIILIDKCIWLLFAWKQKLCHFETYPKLNKEIIFLLLTLYIVHNVIKSTLCFFMIKKNVPPICYI